MHIESTIEDILKVVGRFRILCVGRSGVGKSSLINCVFGVNEASVAHLEPGEATIDKEYTSKENPFFVLHDSKGFEPGDTGSFDIVSEFIRRRRDDNLPLKEQLHAVWLCTETPRAGGRIFETGDERLLQLAYQTQTPVVIVFTKYDKLVRTKKDELREENPGMDSKVLDRRSEVEVRNALDECVQCLKHTLDVMETPMVPNVNVSDRRGYEAHMSSLVEVTRDLVRNMLQNDASVIWAIAQRASLPVKIDVCVAIAMRYHRIALRVASDEPMSLHDCLARFHQDIITSWNFRDEEKILSSPEFQQLMLYIVQDVQESQNQDRSHVTPPPAIDKISEFLSLMTTAPVSSPMAVIDLTPLFVTWFSHAVLDNRHPAQRLLIAYTADLITLLKSLFDIVIISSFSGRTTWFALKDVFQASEWSDSHQQIHRRICADFPHDQQLRDPNGFHRLLRELLKDTTEPVPSPSSTGVPVPIRQRAGVHPPPPHRTRVPSPPRSSTNPRVLPPGSRAAPAPPPQTPAKSRNTKPSIWRRLFPFLPPRSPEAS